MSGGGQGGNNNVTLDNVIFGGISECSSIIYRGKAKYLMGVILNPVLLFLNSDYFFLFLKNILSELCNYTKFLLQQ